jgi:signal transduction histidine kinase
MNEGKESENGCCGEVRSEERTAGAGTAATSADVLRENEQLRREIADCRQMRERIKEQNEFINHVIESLTHPFYVVDANDYTIKMANSAALGGRIASGTTCYVVTHRRAAPCDGREHSCPLQLVKQTKKPVTLEHIHFDRNGNPRNFEVHGYPIFDDQDNVVQMIEYSLDITDRKKMEEALRDSAEKIKLFAYAISHDLKSPMTGILGLLRLLQRDYRDIFPARGRAILDQVLKAGEQVVVLVDEINTYIRAKEHPLQLEKVDPLEILHAVREEFAAQLGLRGISWSEPETLPVIVADRVSLVRVFRNLVDNAVRYGGEKMDEISIGYRDDGTFHVFSVRDNGVGIQEGDAEKIFEAFGRAETAKGVEGSGLGLAIVRELVEKQRGQVWLESDGRTGVTFFVSLPKDL